MKVRKNYKVYFVDACYCEIEYDFSKRDFCSPERSTVVKYAEDMAFCDGKVFVCTNNGEVIALKKTKCKNQVYTRSVY